MRNKLFKLTYIYGIQIHIVYGKFRDKSLERAYNEMQLKNVFNINKMYLVIIIFVHFNTNLIGRRIYVCFF